MQISSLTAIISAAISSFNQESNAEENLKSSNNQLNIQVEDFYLAFVHNDSGSAAWCGDAVDGYRNFAYSGNSNQNYTLQIPNSGSNQGDYLAAYYWDYDYAYPTFQGSANNLLTVNADNSGNCVPYLNGVEMKFYSQAMDYNPACNGVMVAPVSYPSSQFPAWVALTVKCNYS